MQSVAGAAEGRIEEGGVAGGGEIRRAGGGKRENGASEWKWQGGHEGRKQCLRVQAEKRCMTAVEQRRGAVSGR